MSKPTQPEIALENYKAVYDHYDTFQPNPRIFKAGSALMRAAFRPSAMEFLNDAEAELDEHFDENGVIVLASNHTRLRDPMVIASAVSCTPALEPMRSDAVIPTKTGLFQQRTLRWAVEGMGSVPAFREKDITHADRETTSDERRMLGSASVRLIGLLSNKLVQGKSLGIFPEGTRNKTDRRTVQALDRGVAMIASKAASRGANVAIVPLGVAYHGPKALRRPALVTGGLIRPEAGNAREIIEVLRTRMQKCVDAAFEKID